MGSMKAAAGPKTFLHKTRGVGASWVAPTQPKVKLRHLLLQLPVFLGSPGRQLDFTVLVGQIALVQYLKAPFEEVEKADYVQVVHQRATDVIDLSACIFTARVGKEEDVPKGDGAWSEVVQPPFVILPDGVELCLDEEARRFPDSPARQLFSTMADNVLWHDAEAFKQWLVSQGFVRN